MQLDESDGRYAMNYMRNMLFIIVTLSVLIYKYYINFYLFCFSFTVMQVSAHIGETFYCFRKALDGLICIAMFNAIADTVFDVTF